LTARPSFQNSKIMAPIISKKPMKIFLNESPSWENHDFEVVSTVVIFLWCWRWCYGQRWS